MNDDTTRDADNRGAGPNYGEAYSEKSFRRKVAVFVASAGRKVIRLALVLYHCLVDPNTPKWVTAPIASALGYFIVPTDVIPDAIPGAGFSDDLGVLMAAAAYLATHLKAKHWEKAEAQLRDWFAGVVQ